MPLCQSKDKLPPLISSMLLAFTLNPKNKEKGVV
jgi:hypothetical protein